MKAAEYKDGKTIYRAMTPEEIAELEAMQAAMPEPQPTLEDRFGNVERRTDALETTTDDIILLMADLIGGA